MSLIDDFQLLILRPTLRLINHWSPSAELLLLGTVLAETYFTHLKQIEGPALGFYQLEPATYAEILKWLTRPENAKLKQSILAACWMDTMPDVEAIVYNLRFATCMTRAFYMRFEEPLPAVDDHLGLANYYKKYYNTSKGAAHIEYFVNLMKGRVIDEA